MILAKQLLWVMFACRCLGVVPMCANVALPGGFLSRNQKRVVGVRTPAIASLIHVAQDWTLGTCVSPKTWIVLNAAATGASVGALDFCHLSR